MANHSKNSSVSITFTAADSKRQIQSILGKNANETKNNKNAVASQRKQLLSEKQQLLKEKKKFNEMKRKKLRSHSNITKPKSSKKHKNSNYKKSDLHSRNDKIVKEQQKMSTEWMKISKEKVLLSNESIKLKKEKLKLSKERKENDKETKSVNEEKKKLQNLHKKWKQESEFLLKQIEAKYATFNSIKDKKKSDSFIEERRNSLGKHVNNLCDMSTINQIDNENDEKYDIPVSDDISGERLKLQRMQKAAKDSQKRAEKTLSELYRKKQELKKEQAQFESDRLRFKRMEVEYNQFVKEKQRLKKEKRDLLKTQKTLMVHTQKKSRMQLTSAAELENEKSLLAKTKNVLQHKQGIISKYERISVANLGVSYNEQREYRDLRKKVVMYQDQIDALENQNKILQRKIKKHDKFAANYAEDMSLGQKNMQNTKYLISTLRSKVIELQSRNKLLTKLIKRHKNVNDAYQSVSDLKQARKIITKLVIKRDELMKRLNVLSRKLQRRKDLGDKYQTQLYEMYDEPDEDESDEEEKRRDFQFESMSAEETQSLYESMKEKITELALVAEEMEQKLQDRETELLQFESYANEWDIKQRLGDDRGKALYGKLRIGNGKLQNKLDVVYTQLEKEKAAAMTWQSTIEDRLLGDGGASEEQSMLINQLKEENKKLLTQIEFNKVEDVKGHKAIAMDINEQFGTGLFNNLQYILMDADLNNDDILKLKIKDKNDEIYKVVLIKQKGEVRDDGHEKKKDEMDRVLGMVGFEQKNMVNRLDRINGVIDGYGGRILRIVDMLRHIKNSRKILSDAISEENKSTKPKFDLVVSELRQISLPSSPSKRGYLSPVDPHRHHKTMRRFVKTNYRNESMESLDSVYDLSHEDNLASFGMDVEDDQRNGRHHLQSSVDVNSRISQFNQSTTPASLYYPNHHSVNSDSERKKKEDDAAQLTEEDVGNIFNYYDPDGSGTISVQELIAVFNQLGVDTSDKSKLQSIVASLDVDSDGIVTRDNFITWWFSSSANLVQFDSSIRSLLFLTTNNDNFQGQKSDELHAFAQYLNRIYGGELQSKTDYLARYFPIDSGDGGHDLLSKCVDGVLLSKMINFAVPNTIDERVLHFRDNKNDNIAPKQIVENLNIVLSSCKAIGVDLKLFEISVEKFLDPSYYEDIIRQILSELSKIHLSKAINLKANPVLIRLAFVYEDDDMIRSITSESWLMRWINYQLKRSGEDKRIKNFGRDFRDGSVLSHVLYSVTRRKKRKHERFDVNVALSQPTYARPGFILQQLQRRFAMKETIFVAANDILSGNSRLICLLCAQIFVKFKGMRKITKQELQQVDDLYVEDGDAQENGAESGGDAKVAQVMVTYAAESERKAQKYKKGDWDTQKGRKRGGSKYKKNGSEEKEVKEEEAEDALERDIREERDIVNWINEIFSASKLEHKISNLTRDVRNGLILLFFLDLMAANIVEWGKYVILKGDMVELSRQQCLTNCHYIISLIKKEPFSSSFFDIELIPNDGNDIYSGNKEVIFKICHNLINYYYTVTISQLLAYKATEFDIIHWTNQELQKNKKKYPRFCSYEEKKLHSFQDSTLKSCLYYIDLLLILMDDPRQDIDRDIVIHKNNRQFTNNDYTKSECLSNARYALSIARKFGAIFYISPHDLVNVKLSEITMSFVMCIMLLILTKNEKEKPIKKRKNNMKNNKDNNAPIVDALQIHLQEQKNTTATFDGSDTELSVKSDDFQNMQKKSQHGRRRSVLQEYGIITNDSQLQELQDISRQYSTPNIVTPKVPEQAPN